MKPEKFILIFVTLIMSALATPIPFPSPGQPNEREQVSPFAPVRVRELKPIGDARMTTEVEAQERQDYPPGEAPVIGPMLHTIFGGKKPFEAISGPYYSTSIGPAFATGPFSGLGQPLSSGPLGGIMGVPLLFLTMSG